MVLNAICRPGRRFKHLPKPLECDCSIGISFGGNGKVCILLFLDLDMASAKTDPASDPSALRPDASDVFSASHASCAS